MLIGDFTFLVTMYSVVAWLFYLLAVFALLILRVTDPYCSRPFKVWTIIPIGFCILSAGLLAVSIWEAPFQSGVAIIFLALGYPVYYCGFAYFDEKIESLCSWGTLYHSVGDEIELNEVD